MNIDKALQQLGFKPEEYVITNDDFIMVYKQQEQRISPAEFDESGRFKTHMVDITPAKPLMEQLIAADEEVQLKESDIVLLIDQYLQNKERDPENDSFNIVDGLLYSFDFTHVEKPSNAELLSLKVVAEAKVNQEQINDQALKYLISTDFLILRSIENPNKPVSEEIKQLRQAARDSIVR